MKKACGFKTQPSTYSIGLAPSCRARCRLCKQRLGLGEVRIVTCAFVRPGRRHDFVSHASCATPALASLSDTEHVWDGETCTSGGWYGRCGV